MKRSLLFESTLSVADESGPMGSATRPYAHVPKVLSPLLPPKSNIFDSKHSIDSQPAARLGTPAESHCDYLIDVMNQSMDSETVFRMEDISENTIQSNLHSKKQTCANFEP